MKYDEKEPASLTWILAAWSRCPGWENDSIDCTGVENALDVTMMQRLKLDYLIYNDHRYVDLILNGQSVRKWV